MKIVDISHRFSKPLNEESDNQVYELKNLVEFDLCTGCRKPSPLKNHVCKKCRVKFGEKCGILFQKFRENPLMFAKFYEVLPPNKRKAFVILFGLPDGCLEPEETPPQGSRKHLRVVYSAEKQNPPDQNS